MACDLLAQPPSEVLSNDLFTGRSIHTARVLAQSPIKVYNTHMREPTNFRANEIERLLAQEGRKSRWLAEQVGISESHLSRIVSGERRISESLAKRIANAINAPLFLAFEFTDVNSNVLERSAA